MTRPRALQVANPSPTLLYRGFESGKYQRDEFGELLKRCADCKDYWPATNEFFWAGRNYPDGLHCYCKACYLARRWPNGRPAQAPDRRTTGLMVTEALP